MQVHVPKALLLYSHAKGVWKGQGTRVEPAERSEGGVMSNIAEVRHLAGSAGRKVDTFPLSFRSSTFYVLGVRNLLLVPTPSQTEKLSYTWDYPLGGTSNAPSSIA